jgi:hypothetical protein
MARSTLQRRNRRCAPHRVRRLSSEPQPANGGNPRPQTQIDYRRVQQRIRRHDRRARFAGGPRRSTREQLVASIAGDVPDARRRFLLSVKQGKPDWSLLEVENAPDLPAVRWRKQNLDKLKTSERNKLIQQLEKLFSKNPPPVDSSYTTGLLAKEGLVSVSPRRG